MSRAPSIMVFRSRVGDVVYTMHVLDGVFAPRHANAVRFWACDADSCMSNMDDRCPCGRHGQLLAAYNTSVAPYNGDEIQRRVVASSVFVGEVRSRGSCPPACIFDQRAVDNATVDDPGDDGTDSG